MTDLLARCSEAFKRLRTSVWEAAGLLYQVREENAAGADLRAFSRYVEQDLGVSRGFASKLLKAYEHFVIEGGVSLAKLQGLDHEKAYLATRLGGSVADQLSKALTLSRNELREEQAEDEPHDHRWVTVCSICHVKKD